MLPGAPERVELVKKQWENAVDLEFNREFRSAKGTYDGMDLACVSTGIGTTGAISECFQPGDLIIPVAAIRADGTSDCYVDKAFPAVADRMVVNALCEACERLGYRYGTGIMYSPSSLYIGQGRKISEHGFWPSHAEHLIEDLRQARVTNIDTDSAGHFIVGYLHGMRSASILAVITNRITGEWATDKTGEDHACRAACEAMKILKEWDEHPTKYSVFTR